MKTRAAFLCCSFAICLPSFGQGETNAKLPDHVKLVPDFAKSFAQFKVDRPKPSLVSPILAAGPACAHIVMIPVPRGMDSKIILRGPDKSSSRMPILKGLPACDTAGSRKP